MDYGTLKMAVCADCMRLPPTPNNFKIAATGKQNGVQA